MPAPIALQLYTLREAAARDFEAAVRKVAGIGYLGVEPAGADPAGVIAELGPRAPLVHLKDGPCTREDDMLPLGEGITDFDRIAAAGGSVDWWIVELDRCATDMTGAVAKSHAFLTGGGYARGR